MLHGSTTSSNTTNRHKQLSCSNDGQQKNKNKHDKYNDKQQSHNYEWFTSIKPRALKNLL